MRDPIVPNVLTSPVTEITFNTKNGNARISVQFDEKGDITGTNTRFIDGDVADSANKKTWSDSSRDSCAPAPDLGEKILNKVKDFLGFGSDTVKPNDALPHDGKPCYKPWPGTTPRTETAPTKKASTKKTSTETAPIEKTSAETASTKKTSTETASTKKTSTETAPIETAPIEKTSAETASTKKTSTETASIKKTSTGPVSSGGDSISGLSMTALPLEKSISKEEGNKLGLQIMDALQRHFGFTPEQAISLVRNLYQKSDSNSGPSTLNPHLNSAGDAHSVKSPDYVLNSNIRFWPKFVIVWMRRMSINKLSHRSTK